MTEVKICGLRRQEDVALACALGARYLGFNFIASSPRRVTSEEAAELSAAAAPGVLKVGVFAEDGRDQIARVVEAAGLDLVQFHGRLRPEDLAQIPVQVLAVARVEEGAVSAPPSELLIRCRALLFDASEGSGLRFDWTLLRGLGWPVPVFLAGGLDADNVGVAIRTARPRAVDVASGVESSPGIKDPGKLGRFFAAVRKADREAS